MWKLGSCSRLTGYTCLRDVLGIMASVLCRCGGMNCVTHERPLPSQMILQFYISDDPVCADFLCRSEEQEVALE